MEKTKCTEEEKRNQFCLCKNSCQRKTGPKRSGCPCKDEELYCNDKCECGTSTIVCRNNPEYQRSGAARDNARARNSSTDNNTASRESKLFHSAVYVNHFNIKKTVVHFTQFSDTLCGNNNTQFFTQNTNMEKTKCTEEEKRNQFCSCKNSCQRKTGPKRSGCPCKDEELYCNDECECGTSTIVCRNSPKDQRSDVARDNACRRNSCTDTNTFCSCENSCQRKTGPKRSGCPCKDEELYCNDKCECGTSTIVCRNNPEYQRLDVVPDNVRRRNSSTDTEKTSDVSNLVIVDESDGDTFELAPLKQEKEEGKTQHDSMVQSVLERSHKINKGYALVFHNRFFQRLRAHKGQEVYLDRQGSEKDVAAIKAFCKQAGLTIDIQENLEVKEIRRYCKKLAENQIFQDFDGFICFILSHGNSSGVCGSKLETISVKEIVTYFKECNELLTKPKLFFIQACRAGGWIEDDSSESDPKNKLSPPDSSDILIAHSTMEDKLSFRHMQLGSWFIQSLMKQLRRYGKSLHLMDILTAVNDDMAGNELEGKRQMPVQVTSLTKYVYFKMATIS